MPPRANGGTQYTHERRRHHKSFKNVVKSDQGVVEISAPPSAPSSASLVAANSCGGPQRAARRDIGQPERILCDESAVSHQPQQLLAPMATRQAVAIETDDARIAAPVSGSDSSSQMRTNSDYGLQ